MKIPIYTCKNIPFQLVMPLKQERGEDGRVIVTNEMRKSTRKKVDKILTLLHANTHFKSLKKARGWSGFRSETLKACHYHESLAILVNQFREDVPSPSVPDVIFAWEAQNYEATHLFPAYLRHAIKTGLSRVVIDIRTEKVAFVFISFDIVDLVDIDELILPADADDGWWREDDFFWESLQICPYTRNRFDRDIYPLAGHFKHGECALNALVASHPKYAHLGLFTMHLYEQLVVFPTLGFEMIFGFSTNRAIPRVYQRQIPGLTRFFTFDYREYRFEDGLTTNDFYERLVKSGWKSKFAHLDLKWLKENSKLVLVVQPFIDSIDTLHEFNCRRCARVPIPVLYGCIDEILNEFFGSHWRDQLKTCTCACACTSAIQSKL